MAREAIDFIDMLLIQAARTPEAYAISDKSGERLTYAELEAGMLSVSAELDMELLGKCRVLFLARPTPSNMVKALGILHAGHALVIVDPFTSDELFKARVSEAGATHILADSLLLRGGKYQRAVSLVFKKQIADAGKLNLAPVLKSSPGSAKAVKRSDKRNGSVDDPAVIVFTSGTTSNPKGVKQTFRSLTSGLPEVAERFDVDPGDRVLSEPMTLGLVALTHGAEWVQSIKPRRSLEDERINIWFGTPHDASLLPEMSRSYGLKTLGVGAGPVLPALVSELDKRMSIGSLLCVYGMTEILPISVGDARDKRAYLDMGDYVGEPLENVSVRVDDGELLVRGPGVASYINFESETDGWLRTGDFGSIVEDSEYGDSGTSVRLVLQGRKKDMFIRRDMNIYPGLYEPAISAIDGVREAYLTGVQNSMGDDYIVLVLLPEPGSSPQKVSAFVESQLHRVMDAEAIPDEIVCVSSVPKKGRANKVDRKELENIVSEKINK